jgi:HEAT repeat protein
VAVAPKVVEPKSVVVPPDAPPELTPERALDRARVVLHELLKANSSRVQRVAALALSRTGDAPAIEMLATALPQEQMLSARLDIAYALARGGDKRGLDALTALTSGERESRHMAGTKLAALGDKRAVRALRGSLDYDQFRLGAAVQLARFDEPKALKALDKVRTDEKATPDEKARALAALGQAGRAEVAPELRQLLADDRNNLFAAAALAELHDAAARPVLEKQLMISALRVRAARALRRLAPDADIKALLPPLVAALDNNRDTEQAAIAEAILLLAGPAAWSEYE